VGKCAPRLILQKAFSLTVVNKLNLVILGMHRSGTSMVAGALSSVGIGVGDTDELMEAREDNPLGFWERRDVVALNDRLLQASGNNWFNPGNGILGGDAAVKGEIEVIFRRLGGESWLLKDPRMIVTWHAWEDQLRDVLPIFVYRGAPGVASSLERRNGLPLDFGLALWEHYNRQALNILQGRDFIALSYEQFATNPAEQLKILLSQLNERGLVLNEASLSDSGFFDSALNHTPKDNSAIVSLMTSAQRELHDDCLALLEQGSLPAESYSDDPVLSLRIASMAKAFEHSIDAKQLAEDLTEKIQQVDSILAQLHQTEVQLEQVVVAEAEVRADRDLLLAEHNELIAEHNELIAENKALAAQLDYSYEKLLSFADSGLGHTYQFVAWVYKLLTLRRGLSTAYEDILGDAAEHFKHYGKQLTSDRTTRSRLLLDVIGYVAANPAGSRKSFSIPRLKRALSVFLKADRDDLALWVNQRFPTKASLEIQSVVPELGEDIDDLKLAFPVFEKPRVSIIVPVYNQYRMTMFCLRSVLEHSGDVDYEIILSDDASSDLTATIEQRVSGITVARAEGNLGFVRNCNAGAERARGDYLLFLNNDTSVTEGWLSSLVKVLDERPTAGIVGPKLLFGSGELQEAGGIIWDDASGWNFGRMDDTDKPEYNYLKETDYVSGACLLIRSSLWQQLGGFDERYVPAYYEDTDICFAAREAGFSVIYQPASRIFHFEGVSNGTDLDGGVKQHQVDNQAKFLDKWQAVLQRDHFPNGEHVFKARDRSRFKRTVLVIDHYVPSYDKDAGSRSTWLYLQLLVEMEYNVKFIGANFFPHQPYTGALQQLGVEVLVGEHMARNLDNWLDNHAADIHAVYIHRPHVAEQFIASLEKMSPRPAIIFFGHDLHYIRKQRELEVTGDASAEIEARDWRRREYKLFGRMDHVYYPSQTEVDEIQQNAPELSLKAIPLYVLDDLPLPQYIPQERSGLLFVGGFNHPPNADGIAWFVEKVLPLVREKAPQTELHIVGSNIPEEIKSLGSEGVVVHGYLSDEALLELYSSIKSVIVPLRFGAGVKGKVVEALQQGVPLITTTIGAEGLPDAESVLHIADDHAGFASRILAVESNDPVVDQKLACYQGYLLNNFSKARAREIISRDFGEPRMDIKCAS
jgi:GT2 family glycosyltransferase